MGTTGHRSRARPAIGTASRGRPAPDVVCTELENGDAVLLHARSLACYTLNPTGLVIWHGLRDGLSVGETAARITARYDVPNDEATADVLEIATRLAESGLAVFDGEMRD